MVGDGAMTARVGVAPHEDRLPCGKTPTIPWVQHHAMCGAHARAGQRRGAHQEGGAANRAECGGQYRENYKKDGTLVGRCGETAVDRARNGCAGRCRASRDEMGHGRGWGGT